MDTTVTDDNRFYDKNGELIKKVYDDKKDEDGSKATLDPKVAAKIDLKN